MARATWQDSPSTATPLSASRLNDLEARKPEVEFTAVNIRDYRTAIHADDTISWGLAMTAGSGGAVFIPDDRPTVLVGDVSVPAGTRVFGTGRGSIITTDDDIFLVSRCEIDHLYVTTRTTFTRNGSNIPTTTSLRAHIFFYDDPNRLTDCKAHHIYGEGVEIDFFKVDGFDCYDCDIQGGWFGGIGEQDCTDGRITNCRVRYSQADGIAIYGGDDIHLKGCYSHHNRKNGFFHYGVNPTVFNSGATRITYEDCEAAYSTEFDGFDINGTGNDIWTFHQFSNCRSHDNFGWGYNLTGSGNTYQNIHAWRNGLDGIVLHWDAAVAAEAAHQGIVMDGCRSYDNATRAVAGQKDNVFINKLYDSTITNLRAFQPSTGTAMDRNLYVAEHKNCDINHIFAPSYVAAQVSTDMVNMTAASGKFSRCYNIRRTTADFGFEEQALSPSAWTVPTLLNSWVDYGGGTYETVAYSKDADGLVRVRGAVKSGTVTPGTTIFTLPAGYRPSAIKDFPSLESGSLAYLRVNGSGNVQIISGSNGGLVLDPIQFRAAA